MQYADGTRLDVRQPYGLFSGGRALCPDGKIRALKRIASTADTFFSIPASVTYKGKTVAGYVTIETREGWSTPSEDDPHVVKFIPYTYCKNGGLFDES